MTHAWVKEAHPKGHHPWGSFMRDDRIYLYHRIGLFVELATKIRIEILTAKCIDNIGDPYFTTVRPKPKSLGEHTVVVVVLTTSNPALMGRQQCAEDIRRLPNGDTGRDAQGKGGVRVGRRKERAGSTTSESAKEAMEMVAKEMSTCVEIDIPERTRARITGGARKRTTMFFFSLHRRGCCCCCVASVAFLR